MNVSKLSADFRRYNSVGVVADINSVAKDLVKKTLIACGEIPKNYIEPRRLVSWTYYPELDADLVDIFDITEYNKHPNAMTNGAALYLRTIVVELQKRHPNVGNIEYLTVAAVYKRLIKLGHITPSCSRPRKKKKADQPQPIPYHVWSRQPIDVLNAWIDEGRQLIPKSQIDTDTHVHLESIDFEVEEFEEPEPKRFISDDFYTNEVKKSYEYKHMPVPSIEEVEEIAQQQNGICPISGLQMTFTTDKATKTAWTTFKNKVMSFHHRATLSDIPRLEEEAMLLNNTEGLQRLADFLNQESIRIQNVIQADA